MKKVHLILAASLLAVQPAFADKGRDGGKVKVDDSFGEVVLVDWGGDTQGTYTAMMKITSIDGFVAVCGVGHLSSASMNKLTRKVLRGYTLTADGVDVLDGLNFFTNVRRKEDLTTADATCRISSTPTSELSESPDWDIKSGRTSFRS